MTISSEQNRVSYAGNGATEEFAVPFRFLEDSDLVVQVVDDSTGDATAKVLDTDYTVDGAGDAGGGTVTFLTSEEMGETEAVDPPQSGETVLIWSDPPLTQLVDYTAGGPLPAEAHERALDRGVLQNKRTREIAERSLHIPDADPDSVTTEIPNKVDRASMVLGFDSDGAPKMYSATDPTFDTFTANRAMQTDGGGNLEASDVSATALDRIANLSSDAQDQLDDKLEESDVSGTVRSYTKQQNFGAATLTDGANISWDLDDGQSAKVTLEGNRTLDDPTNMVDGGTYVLRVIQDENGNRTLSYGSAYDWGDDGAPTLSTDAGAIDILTFVSDGTKMYGAAKLGFG